MAAISNPEIAEMLRKGVAHAQEGTMELLDEIRRIPAKNYTDPENFQRELIQVFRRLPLMLAPSCELAQPGDYKTLEIAGVPLLVTRGKDNVARTFVNCCTHRGSTVVGKPRGNTNRFTCAYHGWTFGQKGELIGVASQENFGEIDKNCYGLRALPTAERCGLIFATLDPKSTLDIDDYLCGYDRILSEFRLQDWHFFDSHELPGPNWKLVYDGTIDFYHITSLHKNTLAASGQYSNRAIFFGGWGPHQRALNPDARIKGLAEIPEQEWDDVKALAGNWSLFPNVTIASFNAGFSNEFNSGRAMMINMLAPGEAVGSSVTHMLYLTEKKPQVGEAEARCRAQFKMLQEVMGDEDLTASYSQQKGLNAGLMKDVLFGRNEGGAQVYHGWLEKVMQADDEQLVSLFGNQ